MQNTIHESGEQKVARYIVGLRMQIQDVVVQEILTVDGAYQLARRAKKQTQRSFR